MLLNKPMLGTQLDHSDSLNNPVLDLLFNEGHGNRVNDLSGYSNHGTLYGFDFPPTRTSGWNPGMDGIALSFNGDSDYINCGNNPSLNITGNFTIDTLIMLMGDPVPYSQIVDKESDLNGYSLMVRSDRQVYFWSGDGDDWVNSYSTTVLQDYIWYHITGVYDGQLRVYINGLPDGTPVTQDAPGLTPADAMIGCHSDDLQRLFNGMIAITRIFPRAMSAFEVMQTQINPYAGHLQ